MTMGQIQGTRRQMRAIRSEEFGAVQRESMQVVAVLRKALFSLRLAEASSPYREASRGLPPPLGEPLSSGSRDFPRGQGRGGGYPALDVIFPVVHGLNGEDGTIQGLLELANLPYVGAGVLGSALGLDKIYMKRAFAAAGLPVVDYVPITRRQYERDSDAFVALVEERIGFPFFTKFANFVKHGYPIRSSTSATNASQSRSY